MVEALQPVCIAVRANGSLVIAFRLALTARFTGCLEAILAISCPGCRLAGVHVEAT